MKIWKWLRVEVIACGISWSELERAWNLQAWSTKKPHNLGVPFFDLGIFKGCYTLLWNHASNELRFFQNFQDKPRNFNGVFTKAFPQPACLFFSLEQTTDRQMDLLFWVLSYPAYWTDLELLPEPPQNKICYRLNSKCTSLSCFSLICSSAIILIWNKSYTRKT